MPLQNKEKILRKVYNVKECTLAKGNTRKPKKGAKKDVPLRKRPIRTSKLCCNEQRHCKSSKYWTARNDSSQMASALKCGPSSSDTPLSESSLTDLAVAAVGQPIMTQNHIELPSRIEYKKGTKHYRKPTCSECYCAQVSCSECRSLSRPRPQSPRYNRIPPISIHSYRRHPHHQKSPTTCAEQHFKFSSLASLSDVAVAAVEATEPSAISVGTLEQANDRINYSPSSSFLRRLRNQAHQLPRKFECDRNCSRVQSADEYQRNIMNDLEFTDQRRAYEVAGGYHSEPIMTSPTDRDIYKVNVIPQTKDVAVSARTSSSTRRDTPPNIHEVSDFRRANFFETHSRGTITDRIDIPVHTCVHKYELNDRLFPEARHVGPDNESRCIICNLPILTELRDFMKRPGLGLENYEWEYVKRRELLRQHLEHGYVPQQVQVTIPVETAHKNTAIVSQHRGRLAQQLRNPLGQYRFPIPSSIPKLVPVNTFALRYQKGMV